MFSSLIRFAFASAFFVQPLLAQSISKCPSIETTLTALDGSSWSVCASADYQTPSVKIVNSIKNHQDCVQLCQQYTGCKKAVFDKTNWICHLKGNPTNAAWVSSAYYESIRFVSKPAEASKITSCPTGTCAIGAVCSESTLTSLTAETNITASDGSLWATCKNSDYQGNTVQVQNQVTSESACASFCAPSNGCSRVVYDAKNLVCYLKDGTQSTWAFNSNYETIRLLYRPKEGDTLTYCPSGDKNVTSSKGLGYAICNSTDFGGAATNIVDQVSSSFNCMLQCDAAEDCTKAVYDTNNKICFLKSDDAPWAYNPGYQSIRLMNGTGDVTGNLGKWAPAVKFPVVPVGAFVVPEQPVSQRVLAFSSWGPYEFSGPTGITQFTDYNFKTGAVSQRTVTETQHDMFCPGMSYLANGSLVVTGGENAEAVSLYDYKRNSWTRAADMKIARGYQSSTTLSDGRIFTIGGSFTGGIGGQDAALKVGEVYDPTKNSWTLLNGCDVKPMLTTFDAEGTWRTDNHAWLYGWKDGFVFQAGPSKTMHWYGTRNGGSVQFAGTRDGDNDAMCGINAMYDAAAGKILSAGGSQSYTNSDAFTKAHLITIGQPNQAATVESLPDMNFPRGFANTVVLPNGQVIILGGQARSLVFTDIQSIYAAELWDPTTKNFTVLAPASIPRNYHSVALLLSDGTVWSAGGGLCPVGQGEDTAFCDQTINHFDGQIFTPPYLFNADGTDAVRPSISSLRSATDSKGFTSRVGGTLTVDMKDSDKASFALVRLGSSTHSINTDQRRVPLANVTKSQARYTIKLPADSGILLPGYYYLFAMSEAGTPSIARTIQITL